MNFCNGIMFSDLISGRFLANPNIAFLPDISLPLSAMTTPILGLHYLLLLLNLLHVCANKWIKELTYLPKEQQQNNTY